MRAVALLLCLALPVYAADSVPTDAPVLASVTAEPDAPKCYSAEERANIAKTIVYKNAQIDSLTKQVGPSVAVVVLLVVAGVVVGGGAVAGGLAASGHLK